MEKLRDNERIKGITLIALVITIIVLLILAGISVTMLTGENSILKQAVNAREQTIIGQEKENIELAYISAAMKKKGDNVTGEELQHELDLSVGVDKTQVEGQKVLDVLFTETNHSYTVENGKVEKNGPIVNPYNPDEWECAWVYTVEGTWSEKIEKNNPLPSNYKIIAKLYEGKESDVKYSLVIEGEGEIKDIIKVSYIDDNPQFEAYAWQTGIFSSEGPLFVKEVNTVKVIICDGITGIGYNAFFSCAGLKSIKIPDSVTSIGEQTFYYCKNLNSIKIPNSVTSIGTSAFSGCEKVTNIVISNSLTSIERETFRGCKSLTNIEIPGSVTSIGENAFYDCWSLSSAKIANGVTSIGRSAFDGCTTLIEIEIPDSVTSIGSLAFYDCFKLTSIKIPDGVTSLDAETLGLCRELSYIELSSNIENFDVNSLNSWMKYSYAEGTADDYNIKVRWKGNDYYFVKE